MARCSSWTPSSSRQETSGSDAGFDRPGRRSGQWKPCRRRLDTSAESEDHAGRCCQCWEALVNHRDPAVKMSLLAEEDIPNWVLSMLSQDGNPLVSMLAERRLPTTRS